MPAPLPPSSTQPLPPSYAPSYAGCCAGTAALQRPTPPSTRLSTPTGALDAAGFVMSMLLTGSAMRAALPCRSEREGGIGLTGLTLVDPWWCPAC